MKNAFVLLLLAETIAKELTARPNCGSGISNRKVILLVAGLNSLLI